MQHSVNAEVAGVVHKITVVEGETVFEGAALAFIEERADLGTAKFEQVDIDLEHIRPDLVKYLSDGKRWMKHVGGRAASELVNVPPGDIANLVDEDASSSMEGLRLQRGA